jgi:hypothetical protein
MLYKRSTFTVFYFCLVAAELKIQKTNYTMRHQGINHDGPSSPSQLKDCSTPHFVIVSFPLIHLHTPLFLSCTITETK